MAPTEVIDLTSSPEPENTPARAAALSRFKPRKEKVGLESTRDYVPPNPTTPVNGLPFFYGNDGQRLEDVNSENAVKKILKGTAHGHNLHASSNKPLKSPELNGTSIGAQAVVGASSGHPQPSAITRVQHSADAAPLAAVGNGISRASSASAHRDLVNFARPLNGISAECRARLYEPREALAGTPLEYAIRQDATKTHASPKRADSLPVLKLHTQRQLTAESNQHSRPTEDQKGARADCAALYAGARTGHRKEVCPICSKRFKRRAKMEDHQKRCEARRRRGATFQSAAPTQQPLPVLTATYVANPRVHSTGSVLADEPFNMVKHSLTLPSSIRPGGHDSSVKRPRLDLAYSEAHEQPRSKVQIINMTDTTMESVIISDGTENLQPDTRSPGPQLDRLDEAQPAGDLSGGLDRSGLPYSAEEDALLEQLKRTPGLSWPAIARKFSGRTEGSLAFHYHMMKKKKKKKGESGTDELRSDPLELRSHVPSKRIRNTNVADGMIPWASVKKARLKEGQTIEVEREKRRRKRLREQRFSDAEEEVESAHNSSSGIEEVTVSCHKDCSYPSSMSRILRLRELGVEGRRAWSGNPRTVSDELKDHVFKDYGLQRDYQGASGDVISLAWNDDGRFAAGSVAITDQQSMQYNMHRNLLVGDTNRGQIEELLYHHIPRPVIENTSNINANHAMRESQDPRLFPSVVAAKFCPQDSTRLFTASMDKTLRHFTVKQDEVTHRYAINHTSPVSVLSIGGHGLVASGCYQSTRSINVFECDTQRYVVKLQLSARQSTVPVYPSALRWGVAHQHQNFLLAGFSGEEDLACTATGETCLWDASTGQQIHIGGAIRNVFDVAWNPIPTSSSVAFAVVGNANGHVVDRGMQSVVQCFAARQRGGRGVLSWQCPALDVNDLVFCPYDDNLIAAGATNGHVYIWDKRSADRSQRPLHTLKHGESLNVLDHNRNKEMADTGVQFLAWGPTKNRLYSGSSDGIVKIWNPYRSPNNTHVGDISGPSRDRVAIMSGAFSPDYQELLIGTENGRINLFKSGSGPVGSGPPQFKLRSAPEAEKEQQQPFIAARSLVETGQVDLKPCGGMPFRQAVQGPSYSGPFLEPSRAQWHEAQQRLDAARLAQKIGEDDVAKAAAGVQAAEEGVADLERRAYEAMMAKPKAEAFQRELAKLEKERLDLEALVGKVERCKLDCAVLPNGDGNEEVDVSGRSEPRIPGLLRFVANDAVVMEGDVTPPPCPRCVPGSMRRPDEPLCMRAACVLKRARMTSACNSCGKSSLPVETARPSLCERCAFGCFRCGMPVVIGADSTLISCIPCGLRWEIGVLGYELVRSPISAQVDGMEITNDGDEDDLMSEVGDGDREFYAGRWSVLGQ